MNRVIFETSKWMIFLYTYEFPKISGNPNLNNLALLHCISKTWCKSPLKCTYLCITIRNYQCGFVFFVEHRSFQECSDTLHELKISCHKL